MRTFFLFSLSFFLCVASVMQAQEREYVLAIHGGAGAMGALADNPSQAEAYYAALDSALLIGDRLLAAGEEGPVVVMAVVNYLENNPLFNAGKGATVTEEGRFELDASIMLGKDLSAGAVAGVRTVKNPINAAYAVITASPHVFLSGEGADRFAAEQGLETVDNLYFMTPKTMKWVEEVKQKSGKNGTVGCVVLDKQGNLTAGTSTGGMYRKKWGRIGDAPVIGAGTYADNRSCAVSCTGHGEYFIRHVVAYNLCARYSYLGETIEEAANHIIHTDLNTHAGNGGLIAIDKGGNIAMPFNSGGMFRGFLYKEKNNVQAVKKVGIWDEFVER
ncbi:isoaspartyl peptidase/L-asparaginase [Parabacteroides sp. PF5-6]|uniref:isoaspartyl peptidase/L-asparaginase family protein n=1 Tax=Parabacteroides sp. PF5-6 TaxID=1742403 RepID=UPI0024053AA8|nr:isoaspartyl peptidase/L-asparaginase [Parabacteroides sp. PF5-6]MDF9829718.1 beta-aspartyl-peptidase (threonine type) [Parabacteroides sp. PF5-6]